MTQTFRMELGKYLLDISKLIFAGAVISGIMKENIGLSYVLIIGVLSAFGIALLGFLFIKQTKIN